MPWKKKKTARKEDANFPDYAYTTEPLVNIYDKVKKKGVKRKVVARVFLGEWMRVLKRLPSGWVRVRFRGGEGYLESTQISKTRHLEVFFIDVNQGDSILIQTPDDRRILIDGGLKSDAHDFIKNKYRLDRPDNYVDFDAVIVTHSDEDHVGGLIPILNDPKIAVKRIYHNGLFPNRSKNENPGPHPKREGKVFGVIDTWPPEDHNLTETMENFIKAAKSAKKSLGSTLKLMSEQKRWKGRVDFKPEDFVFERVDLRDKYLKPFDKDNDYIQLEILWPRAKGRSGKKYLPWYNSPGETVNGNSVVLRLIHGDNKILLTGDLHERAMDDLVSKHGKRKSSRLRADVYKAAHHGSQKFSVPFCKAVAANASVVMSGDDRNDAHGHPSAVLLGTINRYSRCEKPAVFCTELAACYNKLSSEMQEEFKLGDVALYEKSIEGIVHLRSDGKQLCLGTVHGRNIDKDDKKKSSKPKSEMNRQEKVVDKLANTNWKWDVWTQETSN